MEENAQTWFSLSPKVVFFSLFSTFMSTVDKDMLEVAQRLNVATRTTYGASTNECTFAPRSTRTVESGYAVNYCTSRTRSCCCPIRAVLGLRRWPIRLAQCKICARRSGELTSEKIAGVCVTMEIDEMGL